MPAGPDTVLSSSPGSDFTVNLAGRLDHLDWWPPHINIDPGHSRAMNPNMPHESSPGLDDPVTAGHSDQHGPGGSTDRGSPHGHRTQSRLWASMSFWWNGEPWTSAKTLTLVGLWSLTRSLLAILAQMPPWPHVAAQVTQIGVTPQ